MGSHILSPDEIDALLRAGRPEASQQGLLQVLTISAQGMVGPLQEMIKRPVKIEGPYVESLEHTLDQVISEESYVVPADLGQGELFAFISRADAKRFSEEIGRSAGAAVLILSQTWLEKLAGAVSSVLKQEAPLRLFQARELTLPELAALPVESGTVLIRHLLRWNQTGLELNLLWRDGSTFQALKKEKTPAAPLGAGRPKRGSVIKKCTSPVTEAAFLPLDLPSHAAEAHPITLVEDIDLLVEVELGQVELTLNELLELKPKTVIPLERHAGEAVDVFVNKNPVAKGEVVVLDEHFGVRVLEIVPAAERIPND
ncbi:MAG TPA: hypothetical protein GX528_01770 [Firmicutes bacterium]|nr:hypothetical protein [Bacillota bacterium]